MSHAGWRFSSVFVPAMIFLSCSAVADQCDDLRDPQPRIVACTQSINSGKWKGRNQAINYYNRGNAYSGKGDNDRAIADYNQAISLDPKDATAYYTRGNAYRDKGDNDRAIADYNQVISLDPKFAGVYSNRGNAYRDKGDNDRAIADYNQAISLDPKSGRAYSDRGRLYLFTGRDASKALADLSQANALDPKSAYRAIWLDIARQRNKLPSALLQAGSQIDMTDWPAPIINLFADRLTPAAVLAAADDPDVKMKNIKICEANFFSGELALLRNAKEEATRLLRLASEVCPHNFVAGTDANAELKALGVNP
jgi:lipoprotein NlpI